MIVPTGIATAATTAPFFADLVAKRRLHSLVSFKEIRAVFQSTDDSSSFCLLTLGRDQGTARFAFSLSEVGDLAEAERNFTLTPGAIARLNPDTRTAPVFRSRKDAELIERIYEAAPVLIEEGKGEVGNPWRVEFRQVLFNMTRDSALFRTAAQLAAEGFTRDGLNWRRSGFTPTPPPKPSSRCTRRRCFGSGTTVQPVTELAAMIEAIGYFQKPHLNNTLIQSLNQNLRFR